MTNTLNSHAIAFLSQFNGRITRRDNGFHHTVMRELLALFAIDINQFDFIQITGSCGKGSTAHLISAVLTYHSYDHGLFTGPHLNDYEERFVCNGQQINREEFVSIVMDIKEKLNHYHNENEVGHMHVMILTALIYFKKRGIKLIVFENGVGGKTDPSNIIDPLIAVITEITLDHSHLLGSTIEEIIIDKSCIIKESTKYAICGMNNVQARNYLLKIEAHDVATFIFINRDYGFLLRQAEETGSIFHYKGAHLQLENQKLPLLGAHQVQNASNALAVIEALMNLGYKLEIDMIQKALNNVQIACRMEMIEKSGVNFLFDGAHNTLELRTLKENINALGLKVSHIILSISSNKDIEKMLDSIDFDDAEYIITPHPFLERNSNRQIIEQTFQSLGKNQFVYFSDLKGVMEHIDRHSTDNEIVVVTGSLYLVGYVKEFLFST